MISVPYGTGYISLDMISHKRYIINLPKGDFMSGNKLLDLSFEFSVIAVNIVDNIKTPKSSYMTDQLARAATSIGANIFEAQYSQIKKILFPNLKLL